MVDIGCYAGGELSCLNDGKCLNGVCECRPGYKGKTCSDGLIILIIEYNLVSLYIS